MGKQLLALVVALLLGSFLVASPLATSHVEAAPSDDACWGQATKVFAQFGEMGKHASQQENPRVGLRNLARALYEQGILADDSMQALGAFVAAELGLTIDACMDE